MGLFNIITKLVLPISDLAVGHNLHKQLPFLLDSQWWSSGELKEFQNERLRILIKHAYEQVPYYHDLMRSQNLVPDDIKTSDDLYKLPILTKDIYKQNYPDRIRARNWKQFRFLNRSSSGSTGTPIQYTMTREGYSFNKACHLRGWTWMGFELGDRLMKISQNKRKTFEKRLQDKLNNTYLFSQSYTSENFRFFLKVFNQFKPEYLRSYPDPLQFISLFLEKEDQKLDGLKAINTTGNILFPEVRELIETRFSTKIFDTYSCEGGPNYFECPTHECYHSSMEYGISEILDDNLQEVNPGQNGRLYTTDLWNFTAPFIRYDSKDIVTKSKLSCSCGRQLLNISGIIGRDNDVIITPNGDFLIAQSFTTYFKYLPSIIQFQIYQHERDLVEIRLKVDNSYNKLVENEIYEYWKETLGNEMQIKINVMNEIPLAPSGKRRFLIRNSKIPFTI